MGKTPHPGARRSARQDPGADHPGGAGGGAPAMLTAMTTLSPQARAIMVRTLGEGRMCMR
ncbi:hypothetical protein AoKodu_01000 [Actinomyces oris K20]|nr:hypothetical protein AoKodu_01000 [Actinomyces oris K20]